MLKCLASGAGPGRAAGDGSGCTPGLLDPAHAAPEPKVYWDAVDAGWERAFNDTEARVTGRTMRRFGIDWLVQTEPPVLRRNKRLYDEGHVEV